MKKRYEERGAFDPKGTDINALPTGTFSFPAVELPLESEDYGIIIVPILDGKPGRGVFLPKKERD